MAAVLHGSQHREDSELWICLNINVQMQVREIGEDEGKRDNDQVNLKSGK
jgi:hypothetical protein